jgi:hypothetical protein
MTPEAIELEKALTALVLHAPVEVVEGIRAKVYAALRVSAAPRVSHLELEALGEAYYCCAQGIRLRTDLRIVLWDLLQHLRAEAGPPSSSSSATPP